MRPVIIFVALTARIRAPVLDREILPLLDIAKTVEIVGKAIAVDTKVVRHEQPPGE